MKGHAEIALGNVLGSNLFNLLGVMSLPGLFAVQRLEPIVLQRDYAAMSGLTLLLAAAMYGSLLRRTSPDSEHSIGRAMGVLLLCLYGLYYYWLYQTA